MPVYLFTLHGYATWMPDRKQGYVHHTRGLEPPSQRMTRAYCAKQNEREACFDSDAQEIIIDAVRSATDHLKATLHGIAVDTTHAHLLVSWQHERDWDSMRRSIKGAITRALNDALAKRTWLSKKGSRKRVSDLAHFDHLLLTYLPKHDGAQWYREKDIDAAKRRAAEKTQSEKLQSEKLQSERPQ